MASSNQLLRSGQSEHHFGVAALAEWANRKLAMLILAGMAAFWTTLLALALRYGRALF